MDDLPQIDSLSDEGNADFEPRSTQGYFHQSTGADTNQFPVISSTNQHGNIHEVETEGRPKLTVLDTVWNITNAIQGMFVLSLPWAVDHGGFFGLFLIVLTAVACAYTGGILIDCLYEETEFGKRKKYTSYQELAKVTLGPMIGPFIVNLSQMLELFMICTLYVVVSGELFYSLYEGFTPRFYSTMVGVILLPCAMLPNLKSVSKFSCVCSIGQFLVYIVIIHHCIKTMDTETSWSEGISKMKFYVEWEEFSVGIGAIVFSYTSQFYLPSLESDMQNKAAFKPMLYWSHWLAAICKAIFALVAYLRYQDQTAEIVSANLPKGSFIKHLVNVLLIGKALTSYPLPYFAIIEMAEIHLPTILKACSSRFRKQNDQQPLTFSLSLGEELNDTQDNISELMEDSPGSRWRKQAQVEPETPSGVGVFCGIYIRNFV